MDTPPTARQQASMQNGAASRGPVTRDGKAVASANSAKHGLQGRALLLPDETVDSYQATLSAWMETLAPTTEGEATLVAGVADLSFRLQRLQRVEERQVKATLDALMAKGGAGSKLKAAQNVCVMVKAMAATAELGRATTAADAVEEFHSAMRTVVTCVADLNLSASVVVKLEKAIQTVTKETTPDGEELARMYAQLATTARATQEEIETELIPSLVAAKEEQRQQLTDDALLDDGKGAKKLERMRNSLQRAFDRQLALVKQVKELAAMGRGDIPLAPIQVELRVLGRKQEP
jgi:hypothetical protein